MNSKRKMQSGRNTAIIWALTLLCYLGAIVAAWQLDFIRYSRYSLEEALKQKQENEAKREAHKNDPEKVKKEAPPAELKKIRDRVQKRKEKEIRKKLEEVEETLEKMEERKEELKEIYSELRDPMEEAYERLFDIAENLSNEFDYVLPFTENARIAEDIRHQLENSPTSDQIPVFRGQLETMKANSEKFRANPSSYLDYGVDPATAEWQSLELERMIDSILNGDMSGVYDIGIMNTPPEMPPVDATLQQLKDFMAAKEEQLDTKYAELNAYQNAIRSMDSLNKNMDQTSMEHFSRDLAQNDGAAEDPQKILDAAEEVLRLTREMYEQTKKTAAESRERIEKEEAERLSRPRRGSTLLRPGRVGLAVVRDDDYDYGYDVPSFEIYLVNEVDENAKHTMEQAQHAYEAIKKALEANDPDTARQDLSFLQTASRDMQGFDRQLKDTNTTVQRKLPDLANTAYMAAMNHRSEINSKLSEWLYNVDPEFADIQEAAKAMDADAESFLLKALDNRYRDEFATVEAEQYLRKLLEALRNDPQNSESQSAGQQGGQMGQNGEQGGQQGGGQGGGGQFMTKEQLLRALEQMTALQDAADSLSSRANSLARMAGINLPLSAERLFSAIQQRAMRNQQGGMRGGQQGQGQGSLADMMRQLARMGREGVERAGQQGQGQGQGQSQGQGQGNGNGSSFGNNRNAYGGGGIAFRGDFDFEFGGTIYSPVGNSDSKRVASEPADYAIIAESVPGRRVSKDAARHGFVFIDSWYVIGPWEGKYDGSRFTHIADRVKREPETRIDLDAEYDGKIDPVTQKPIRLRWRYVQTDTTCIRTPDKMDNAIYYAYTDVHFEEDTDVLAMIGSDDASVLWINGEQVWFDDELSTWGLHENIIPIHFRKGWNTILFCVENGPDECQFSFVMVREDTKAAADAAKRAAEQRRNAQQTQATRPGATSGPNTTSPITRPVTRPRLP
jgi:hypothetical protein